jgi:hypothetical protein
MTERSRGVSEAAAPLAPTDGDVFWVIKAKAETGDAPARQLVVILDALREMVLLQRQASGGAAPTAGSKVCKENIANLLAQSSQCTNVASSRR